MTERKKHLQVTAAVIIKDGWILTAQRPKGARHAGVWEFPGGKQEPGETLAECLKREILEELNLVIFDLRPLISVDHDYGDLSLTLHAFTCRPDLDDEKASFPINTVWVRPNDLLSLNLLPPDKKIAEAIMEKMK